MPSKYVVRNLRENCVYHVFNRATHSQGLFLDPQDYRVFLFYLYVYTNPVEEVLKRYSDLPMRLRDKTLTGKIDVLSYCLMPDHFHLLIRQHQVDTMPRLMKQMANGYTTYYNRKYKRVGAVMQGRYKSVEVDSHNLIVLTRYIHMNPIAAKLVTGPGEYQWSSYGKYLGEENALNIPIDMIMSNFSTRDKFAQYHTLEVDSEEKERIKHLIIES